ncbi:claudin-7-like [Mustelus asterias]
MASARLQILGFMFGIVGLGFVLVATISKEWKITSSATSVITATWIFQGLWTNCAGNALGAVHCRDHLTMFKLAAYIQVARALMIVSICLGFLGSIFALMGMECTNIGGSGRSKAKAAFSAGVMYILAGLSPLVACSWYAHQIILDHYDPIMPKYELGTALFSGWAGATLCILGGLSFCLSVTEDKHSQRKQPCKINVSAEIIMYHQQRTRFTIIYPLNLNSNSCHGFETISEEVNQRSRELQEARQQQPEGHHDQEPGRVPMEQKESERHQTSLWSTEDNISTMPRKDL